jgi:hypothetical protein
MKKINLSLILFAFVMILNGCSSTKNKLIPTANKGGYKVNVVNSKSKNNSDDVVIKGTVFDIKTGKPTSPPVLITIGCIKIQASSQGEYSYKTKNFKYDYFFIEVISIGYKPITTDFLDLTGKNEVKIDFYLTQDDRPLIDCPPPGMKIKE